MITFPPNFTATKYPGYYWNVVTQELYSIKVGGVLKKIKRRRRPPMSCACWRVPNYQFVEGYRVSHLGYRRFLPLDDLMKLAVADSTILVEDINPTTQGKQHV